PRISYAPAGGPTTSSARRCRRPRIVAASGRRSLVSDTGCRRGQVSRLVGPGPLRQVFGPGVGRGLVPAPLVQLHRLRVVAEDVQANAPDSQAPRLVVQLGQTGGPVPLPLVLSEDHDVAELGRPIQPIIPYLVPEPTDLRVGRGVVDRE